MVNTAKRISDNLSQIYSSEAFNVTIPEWRILARLAEDERLNARDIGRITQMDKSKVSRAVKQLDDKGYLIKQKDEQDNRITYLSLSAAGRRLYHELAPRALEWESNLIKALDTSEYRDLMRILEKLDKQLDAMEP
jgi:DNA-binding MarR family transcriptional regulator